LFLPTLLYSTYRDYPACELVDVVYNNVSWHPNIPVDPPDSMIIREILPVARNYTTLQRKHPRIFELAGLASFASFTITAILALWKNSKSRATH